jgi:hypothetical protein
MLYSKINAVMDGRILLRSVMLSSTAGDDVIYEHDLSESTAPFDEPGWWTQPTPTCESETKHNAETNLFVLSTTNPWRDLGLEWISDTDSEVDNGNVLVFTEFRNDKDK